MLFASLLGKLLQTCVRKVVVCVCVCVGGYPESKEFYQKGDNHLEIIDRLSTLAVWSYTLKKSKKLRHA